MSESPAAISDSDIYDRMISAILDYRLPPGTKLVEDKLATAFGVSRTRVRPAIRLAGQFHLHIAERAGHQTLGRILREMVSITSLIIMAYGRAQAREREDARACDCREHRKLLDAIRLGDAAEAGRRMREHLSRVESELRFTTGADPAPDLAVLFGPGA